MRGRPRRPVPPHGSAPHPLAHLEVGTRTSTHFAEGRAGARTDGTRTEACPEVPRGTGPPGTHHTAFSTSVCHVISSTAESENNHSKYAFWSQAASVQPQLLLSGTVRLWANHLTVCVSVSSFAIRGQHCLRRRLPSGVNELIRVSPVTLAGTKPVLDQCPSQ